MLLDLSTQAIGPHKFWSDGHRTLTVTFKWLVHVAALEGIRPMWYGPMIGRRMSSLTPRTLEWDGSNG